MTGRNDVCQTQQVWEDFSAALRAFIRRRVNDAHIADDLLQEVFVRIHNKIDTVTDEDRLSAWLFNIARNVITDHYRRRSEANLDDSGLQVGRESLDVNLNDQVGKWLVQRIAQLPDAYREAVTLSEMNGMRQAEIAEQIGLSVSGAKSRVQRGRQLLKDLLLQCCHFEFDRRGNVIDYQVNSHCSGCCDSSKGECGS